MTSRNEQGQEKKLVLKEEQAPMVPDQTSRSDRIGVEDAQILEGASRLLIVALNHCPGWTMAYSANRDSETMEEAHSETHSNKSGCYEVGRERAQKSVRLQQDK